MIVLDIENIGCKSLSGTYCVSESSSQGCLALGYALYV